MADEFVPQPSRTLTWWRLSAVSLVMLGGLSAAIGLTGLNRFQRSTQADTFDHYQSDVSEYSLDRRSPVQLPARRGELPLEYPTEAPAQMTPPSSTIDGPRRGIPPGNEVEARILRAPVYGLLVYPRRALASGVSGEVRIRCTVSVVGALEHCEVLEERPIGYGFGQAALEYVSVMEATPRTIDGVPVAGGVIEVPIRFDIEE